MDWRRRGCLALWQQLKRELDTHIVNDWLGLSGSNVVQEMGGLWELEKDRNIFV